MTMTTGSSSSGVVVGLIYALNVGRHARMKGYVRVFCEGCRTLWIMIVEGGKVSAQEEPAITSSRPTRAPKNITGGGTHGQALAA